MVTGRFGVVGGGAEGCAAGEDVRAAGSMMCWPSEWAFL